MSILRDGKKPALRQYHPQDIARYPFPDPTDPGRFRGLREKAKRLHEETDYAIIYNARFHVVHLTQYLRGFEDWFMDLAQDQNLFQSMMEAVAENLFELNRRALAEVGEFVDIVAFGDDVGQQDVRSARSAITAS
ncbi:MAG: hypothetical protein U0V70_13695 [Terriglobia bacterium]